MIFLIALSIYLFFMFVVMIAAIVTEEVRITKQVKAWRTREVEPIIKLWSKEDAPIQIPASVYVNTLLPM